MPVSFQNQNVTFTLSEKTRLRFWINNVVKKEGKRCGEINFVFTSDEDILAANIQFLDHNTYTDIITFDNCEGDLIIGDILISIERVKDNALKFKVDFKEELRRVIIHGVLHLCGYKDKKTNEKELMRKKENSALKLF